MTKIDEAIAKLYADAKKPGYVDTHAIVAAALEEIRHFHEAVTASFDNVHKRIDAEMGSKQPAQPIEQLTTFKPWADVVEIVGPTSVAMASDSCFIGFEGIVTDTYGDGEYDVHIGEVNDWFYFPASSLRLVYRLKERKQPEMVAFQGLDGVISTGRQPEPTFRAGEYARDIVTGRTIEIMADVLPDHPRAQCRQVENDQPCSIPAHELQRIDKPAPFQVGDWVETPVTKRHVQITGIQYNDLGKGVAQFTNAHGQTEYIGTEYITKITPSAPRFTFGQMVHVAEFPNTKAVITSIHNDGTGLYDVAFEDFGESPDPCGTYYEREIYIPGETPF